MSRCNDCQECREESGPLEPGKVRIVIVGNLNVGKTTLFSRLVGKESRCLNVPGSTATLQAGRLKRLNWLVLDSPGTYSLFARNEEEIASRDVLLTKRAGEYLGIILVADAKNLKRSIALALQYAEYGLPLALVVNMVDEAGPRGIQIDFRKLSELLGVDVIPTVAREGIGVPKLVSKLASLRTPKSLVTYPPRLEEFVVLVDKLLGPSPLSPRVLALLLLAEDHGVKHYLLKEFGPGMAAQLEALADEFRREQEAEPTVVLSSVYMKKAEHLAHLTVEEHAASRHPWATKIGDWSAQLPTGIPIALLVLCALYLFVGTFGATWLVNLLDGTLFRGLFVPWLTGLLQPIPNAFLRDLIVDPSFGILPAGVFLALGLVMPVMFCFYLAFGVLEESGYLPRLSILLDRLFRWMGLNGKGVVPMALGFSCITMALLTTRMLDTEKEKNIASFLLFLAVPCAPLFAVMLTILERMPWTAPVTVFVLIAVVTLLAGFGANRLLPGQRAPLLLEIPPLRLPRPWNLLRSATTKTWFFMKEAIPVFVLAAAAVFLVQRLGGLALLEKALRPITSTLLGLPDKSVQVLLKAMIRRESGAAELTHLSHHYTNLQLVVSLLMMVFLVPCINSTLVLYKERGAKVAGAILCAVVLLALAVGTAVNHTCRWLGVTFT